MTKPTGRPRGRPPKDGTATTKTLGSVRITDERLALYDQAASLEGLNRTDWVISNLDKAAKRALIKQRKVKT